MAGARRAAGPGPLRRAAGARPLSMKFVFATLQHIESDFYGRVGRGLRSRGHEVSHLTFSRRSAATLRRQGDDAYCLPELMGDVAPRDSWEEEERRIVERYPIPDL